MKSLSKKHIITILGASIIIMTLILVVIGFQVHKQFEQRRLEEIRIEEARIAEEQQKREEARIEKLISLRTTDMETVKASFGNDDRGVRLSILKSLLAEYEEYKNGDEVLKEIITLYEKEIKDMRTSFIAEYDATIEANILEGVENIEETEQLSSSKTILENQLKQIQAEKDVVCSSEEISEYEKTINTLVTSYSARIANIEKEEKVTKTTSILNGIDISEYDKYELVVFVFQEGKFSRYGGNTEYGGDDLSNLDSVSKKKYEEAYDLYERWMDYAGDGSNLTPEEENGINHVGSRAYTYERLSPAEQAEWDRQVEEERSEREAEEARRAAQQAKDEADFQEDLKLANAWYEFCMNGAPPRYNEEILCYEDCGALLHIYGEPEDWPKTVQWCDIHANP